MSPSPRCQTLSLLSNRSRPNMPNMKRDVEKCRSGRRCASLSRPNTRPCTPRDGDAARPAPEGAFFKRLLTVCLKAYPDTNHTWRYTFLDRLISHINCL